MRHACSQPAEHVANGDSHPTNARFSATLSRLHRDYLPVIHEVNLAQSGSGPQTEKCNRKMRAGTMEGGRWTVRRAGLGDRLRLGASAVDFLWGKKSAGEGNRTLVTSLEDWRSTIELHPRHERRYAAG